MGVRSGAQLGREISVNISVTHVEPVLKHSISVDSVAGDGGRSGRSVSGSARVRKRYTLRRAEQDVSAGPCGGKHPLLPHRSLEIVTQVGA